MRNEIYKQIKQSRRTYYYELNKLNKITLEPVEASVDEYSEDKRNLYFGKLKKSMVDLTTYFNHNYSSLKFPKLNPGYSRKNIIGLVKKTIFKGTKFLENLNQSMNKKADLVIEHFYLWGSRIFEDNNDTYYPQLETLPVSASNNIFSSSFDSLIQNEFTSAFSKQFKIAQYFKNIQKNILIFLESDTFTFSMVKKNRVPSEGKEISYYRQKERNSPPTVNALNFYKTQQSKIQKETKPVKKLFYKARVFIAISSFSILCSISNFYKTHLYPTINQFI